MVEGKRHGITCNSVQYRSSVLYRILSVYSTTLCGYMGGILFDRIDRFHQFTACFAIKQAGKQNGLVKGWFHQNRFAFHITVLLDVMNDLLSAQMRSALHSAIHR